MTELSTNSSLIRNLTSNSFFNDLDTSEQYVQFRTKSLFGPQGMLFRNYSWEGIIKLFY